MCTGCEDAVQGLDYLPALKTPTQAALDFFNGQSHLTSIGVARLRLIEMKREASWTGRVCALHSAGAAAVVGWWSWLASPLSATVDHPRRRKAP